MNSHLTNPTKNIIDSCIKFTLLFAGSKTEGGKTYKIKDEGTAGYSNPGNRIRMIISADPDIVLIMFSATG